MSLIIASVFIIISVLYYIYDKNWSNPITIFSGFWGVILCLYSMRLYGLHDVNNTILFMMLVGVVSYTIGGVSGRIIVLKKKNRYISYVISKYRINILSVIAMGIFLVASVENIFLLRSGVFVSDIRYSGEYVNVLLNILLMFVAVPICVAVVAISFANISKGDVNKKQIALTFCLVLGDVLARFSTLMIYLSVAGCIYLLTIFLSRKTGIAKKQVKSAKKGLIPVIIGVAIVGVILGVLREIDLFRHLYLYLTGSIVHFSVKYEQLEIIGRESIYGCYTYGISSFQGLLRFFINVMERVGFESYLFNAADKFYWLFLATPIDIGEGLTFNSFSTPFLYFYKDLGWFGVIFFSYIYGYICMKSYRDRVKMQTTYNNAVYLFFFMSIFMTLMEAPFVKHEFAMAIYYILLMRKGIRSNTE